MDGAPGGPAPAATREKAASRPDGMPKESFRKAPTAEPTEAPEQNYREGPKDGPVAATEGTQSSSNITGPVAATEAPKPVSSAPSPHKAACKETAVQNGSVEDDEDAETRAAEEELASSLLEIAKEKVEVGTTIAHSLFACFK